MKRNTQLGRRLSQILLGLLCVGTIITFPRSQQAIQTPPVSTDRAALHQALLDLTNPWTVMCIAAHPDDEDGTSLIVMRRKYGAHTVSLFSTFGEGGQNAIGPELYEELGAIRARETMAAAEIQGSEPHFLGLKDFGYSKSADEAFRFWGHDEALRRMVLQIRKLRPDVIITNHSATSNDHGHHQATARLELEAFDAAADPKRFPEQLKGEVTVWQVQRLFVRAGRSSQPQANAAGVVTIDPNERDPIRHATFADEALRALQKHATQGPWPKTVAEMARFRNSQDGKLPLIRYALVREANGALPKNPHNVFDGLRLHDDVAEFLQPPTIDGRPLTDFIDQRPQLIQALAAAKDRLARPLIGDELAADSDARYRLSYRTGRIHSALLSAAGIATSLSVKNVLIPGASTSFSFTISNHGSQPLQLESLSPPAMQRDPGSISLQCCPRAFLKRVIQPGESLEIPLRLSTPTNTGLTVPHAAHLYDDKVFGVSVDTYAFARVANTDVTPFAYTMVEVAPPVEIMSVVPSPLVLSPNTDKGNAPFTLAVKNHTSRPFNGRIMYEAGGIDQYVQFGSAFRLAPDQQQDLRGAVRYLWNFSNSLERSKGSISFSVTNNDHRGNARRAYVNSRTIDLVYVAAERVKNLRVGYVRGFDFSLPNALAALGVESKELSVDEVKTADLQKYTTIIVDNRVYESQPELVAANQKLLDYAKAGGTLIVFYHKSNEWNPDERRKRPQLAPYKLVLGDERITDETAPITFVEPQHPLLNSPNKMGQEDFANWIQERGLYYPKDWDPQFHALLQSNDPGEQPLRGGLLVADYGRGHYIYSSMVWYRQLRAGVPGAYRMLANMISYGRTAP